MNWFEGFEIRHFNGEAARIYARVSAGLPGDRPALLLLHGFPQSHVMWQRVAQRLQKDFYLVMPDLRGYGDSSKAAGLPDHSNYSKHAMAPRQNGGCRQVKLITRRASGSEAAGPATVCRRRGPAGTATGRPRTGA